MKIKAIIHTAEEGGYWAEVPVFQGCYTQGETIEEVLENLQEVIILYAEDEPQNLHPSDKIVELNLSSPWVKTTWRTQNNYYCTL